MDKTKEVISNSIKTIKEADFSVKDIKMKIFDNIIWVIILVIVFFFLILTYLSNMSFNVQYKFDSLDKDYKKILKIENLDKKSPGKRGESFDELDINKHTLKEVYISSSAKSYLIGRQMLDFCSKEMVLKCLELGARFIELDLYLGYKDHIVICNGLVKGNWKLTFNTILFEDFIISFSKAIFNPNTYTNYKDPILLYLNINIPKRKMNELYNIIYENIKSFLPNEEYTIRNNKKNILDAPLKELLEKVIIITNGHIGDTDMSKITHLRKGDKVRVISFKELFMETEKDNIIFNKRHLTIVKPEIGISSLNYNPERAWDYGCQIVSLHFQREDDFMKEYIAKFSEKSYLLKPYEFTRFSDIPIKGYDKSKVAYYPTYKDNDLKFFTPSQIKLKKCCKTIMEFDDYLPKLQTLNFNIINFLRDNYSEKNYTIKKLKTVVNADANVNDLNEYHFNIKNLDSSDSLVYKYNNGKELHIKNVKEYTDNDPVTLLKFKYFDLMEIKNNFIFGNNSYSDSSGNTINNTNNIIEFNIKDEINVFFKSKKPSNFDFTSKEDRWTNLNNLNWNLNDLYEKDKSKDELINNFKDQLYFYIGPYGNNVISLYYIYYLIFHNFTTLQESSQSQKPRIENIKINKNNKLLELKHYYNDSGGSLTDEELSKYGIKIHYEKDMDILDFNSINDSDLIKLNTNNFYVSINNKKIFNLNLLFYKHDNTIHIEYKDNSYKLNDMKEKLRAYGIEQHKDIRNIEIINENSLSELVYYVNRHIYDNNTKHRFSINYYNKYDLIYYILRKQVKYAYTKAKNDEMNYDYENKCIKKKIDECQNEKLCYIKEIQEDKDCQDSSNSQIPFPKLCLPRSFVPNRNACFDAPSSTFDAPSSTNELIFNKRNRELIHNVYTNKEYKLGGKWYNPKQKIMLEIPDTFDEYCEIVFTTPIDNKTYSIRVFNDDNTDILSEAITNLSGLDKFRKDKETNKTLRAKGTFVDNNLVEFEKKNNMIPLKIHGYCDMKIYYYKKELDNLVFPNRNKYYLNKQKCINVPVLEAYYQYVTEVGTEDNKYANYLKKIGIDVSAAETNFIINSKKVKTNLKEENIFLSTEDPNCNTELLKKDITVKSETPVKTNKFDKRQLPDIETFANIRQKNLFELGTRRRRKKKVEKPVEEKDKVNKEIDNFFFLTDEKKKILKDLNLNDTEFEIYMNLNVNFLNYFNSLSQEKKKDFLNKSDKEKDELLLDSKYYFTPTSKDKGGLSLDFIKDGNKNELCIKKRSDFTEGGNCLDPRITRPDTKRKDEVCSIEKCYPIHPVLQNCAVRTLRKPYCEDNIFGKWKIEKKNKIKLYNEEIPELCELNDTDYNLHYQIKYKEYSIEYLKQLIKKITIDKIPEEPEELKKKIISVIDKITKELNKLKSRKIDVINDDSNEVSAHQDKIIATQKKLKDEPVKIKNEYIKMFKEEIEKMKKEIVQLKKIIEERKKKKLYSSVPKDMCLGHGEVRRPNRYFFYKPFRSKDRVTYENRLLYCDHRRNHYKYNNFNFKWKTVKIVDNPPKYMIMTDNNNKCLTKKKLYDSKKEPKEDEEEDDDISDEYLKERNGYMEGTFILKPCISGEEDLLSGLPSFNIDENEKFDKKELYIFNPNINKITFRIHQEILNLYGHTKHLESPLFSRVIMSDIGLNFLKNDIENNKTFLKTDLGKKFGETDLGKELIKKSSELEELEILPILKKEDISLMKKELKDSSKMENEVEYLNTSKGKIDFENKTEKALLLLIRDKEFVYFSNEKNWELLITDLGLDYLSNYLGRLFLKTDKGKEFLDSDIAKIYIEKMDTLQDQIFEFENVNNINNCGKRDQDPRMSELNKKIKEDLENNLNKVQQKPVQKDSFKDSMPKEKTGLP